MDEVELEAGYLLLQFSPASHHYTIAPYTSVTVP
jgi:hypothetical protein